MRGRRENEMGREGERGERGGERERSGEGEREREERGRGERTNERERERRVGEERERERERGEWERRENERRHLDDPGPWFFLHSGPLKGDQNASQTRGWDGSQEQHSQAHELFSYLPTIRFP